MRRLTLKLAVIAALSASATVILPCDVTYAQNDVRIENAADSVDSGLVGSELDTFNSHNTEGDYNPETDIQGMPIHYTIKQKFIEGGVGWMTPILLFLIFGLAIAIERILYLNLSTVNTKRFLNNVEDALREGGVSKALELCRQTRGPIASIFYQGLSRYDQGLENVEKSVVSYGSVQTGLMEKGLSWINLFIALSPMLGFMGTVVGMIDAFDSIESAGNITPSLVAGGIKIALLTTLAGLIAAVILQLFYNYIISKIDNLVIDMEDSSIILVDMLVEYQDGTLGGANAVQTPEPSAVKGNQ